MDLSFDRFFITLRRVLPSAIRYRKQMYFDSSFRFLSLINFPSLKCTFFFRHFHSTFFMCFFQFFIADNFYVQQKEPYFDSNQNSNITVLENESVVLKCVVRNKGNKTVSQNYFWYLKLSSFHSCTPFQPRKFDSGDFRLYFIFLLLSLSAAWCFLIKNHGMNNNERENEWIHYGTHTVFV